MFQGFVSFLLPCFAVDHLYLSCNEYLLYEEETPVADGNLDLFCWLCCLQWAGLLPVSQLLFLSSSAPEAARDVLQLVQSLRLISESVSAEMAYEMEKALEYLQTPERAAERVLEDMLCNDT